MRVICKQLLAGDDTAEKALRSLQTEAKMLPQQDVAWQPGEGVSDAANAIEI